MKRCISCGFPIANEKLAQYPEAKICDQCIQDAMGQEYDNVANCIKKANNHTINNTQSDADDYYLDDMEIERREYEAERCVDAIMMAPTGWEDDEEIQDRCGIVPNDDCEE